MPVATDRADVTRDVTTIEIKTDTWRELHGRKNPGESFDDVVRRELGLDDDRGEEPGPESVVEYTDRPGEPGPQGEMYSDTDLPDELAAEIERYRQEQERSETDHVDARVRAARAVGRMLVAEGGVRRQEALDALRDVYDVPGVTDETWWQRAGKDRFGKIDRIHWDQQAQRYVLEE